MSSNDRKSFDNTAKTFERGSDLSGGEAAQAPTPQAAQPSRSVHSLVDLHLAHSVIMTSAEVYCPGVSHRVTMADFSAIVSATLSTVGPGSPLRVRSNVPPSILAMTSAALQATVSHQVSRVNAVPQPKKQQKSKATPPAGKTGRAGKSSSKPKEKPSKAPKAPKKEGEEVDDLARARTRLRRNAIRAFKSKDEQMAHVMALAQITEDLINDTIDSMTLEQIQDRPKGVSVLNSIGLLSSDRLGRLGIDWSNDDFYMAIHLADQRAAEASANPRARTVFPNRKTRLTTFAADDLPFASRAEAVEVLRKELRRAPLEGESDALIPEFRDEPDLALLINIGPEKEDKIHPRHSKNDWRQMMKGVLESTISIGRSHVDLG